MTTLQREWLQRIYNYLAASRNQGREVMQLEIKRAVEQLEELEKSLCEAPDAALTAARDRVVEAADLLIAYVDAVHSWGIVSTEGERTRGGLRAAVNKYRDLQRQRREPRDAVSAVRTWLNNAESGCSYSLGSLKCLLDELERERAGGAT